MPYRPDAMPFDASPSVSAAKFYGTEPDGSLTDGCLLLVRNGKLPKPGAYSYSKPYT
jgi:hypothetical protein